MALEKSRSLSADSFACDALVEAMCYQRLDQREKAVERFQAAMAWLEAGNKGDADLLTIHYEAAQLLGIME